MGNENESELVTSSFSQTSHSSSSKSLSSLGTDSSSGYFAGSSSTGTSSSYNSIPLSQPTPSFSSSSNSNSNNNNNGTSSSAEYTTDDKGSQGDDEESGGNNGGEGSDRKNGEGGNDENNGKGGSNGNNGDGGNEENNASGGNEENNGVERNEGDDNGGGNEGTNCGKEATDGSNGGGEYTNSDSNVCVKRGNNSMNYSKVSIEESLTKEIEKGDTANKENTSNQKIHERLKEDMQNQTLTIITKVSKQDKLGTSKHDQQFSVLANTDFTTTKATVLLVTGRPTPVVDIAQPTVKDAGVLHVESQTLSTDLLYTGTETIQDTVIEAEGKLLVVEDSLLLSETTSSNMQVLQDDTPFPVEGNTMPISIEYSNNTMHESSVDFTLPLATELSHSLEQHISETDSPSILDYSNKSNNSKNISQEAMMTTSESSHLSFHLELIPTQDQDTKTVQDSPIEMSDSPSNSSPLLQSESIQEFDQGISKANVLPIISRYESISSLESSINSTSASDIVNKCTLPTTVVNPSITSSAEYNSSNSIPTDIQGVVEAANIRPTPVFATALSTLVTACIPSIPAQSTSITNTVPSTANINSITDTVPPNSVTTIVTSMSVPPKSINATVQSEGKDNINFYIFCEIVL